MMNPPNRNQGSFEDILKRMTGRVQQQEVDGQILELIQRVFEKELEKENALLSRPDRVRLYKQIARDVLKGVMEKLGS
jgi:hypothetical protein